MSRRNPHKVPVSLINRATLDAVGKAYETRKLPPQSNPDASVLWDMMHDAGCEVLSRDARFASREAVLGYKEVGAVKQGSILHRWIVLDAIQSAESVTIPEGKAAIAAARAWVNDPSERNREAAARAVPYTVPGVAYAGYAAVAASDNYDAPSYAAAAAYASLGGTASAAHLRFRVLETMARAGILPDPPKSNPRRRNPEGERHTSLKEQAESALLWERIRKAKSQKEALAHYRAALLAAEDEKRLVRDRKKAAKARAPKPVYTKAYLAKKGMKRRNPLDMYRKQSLDGEVYFSVPFANHTATLDIQFDKTDWYRPGAAKTLRVLRTSHMAQRPQHGDLGHYGTLVRRLADAGSLTADDLLTAAIKAEASANDMLNAYPRYKYRDAAHYYEGLTEVLTDLAASLQKGWQS